MAEVIFFPRKDYDVEICGNRYGKKMTYTEQTDTLRLDVSYEWFMGIAKAKGIKVGAFCGSTDFADSKFNIAKKDFDENKIWFDEYSFTQSLADKITTGGVITKEEFDNSYSNELLPSFFNAMGKKPISLSYSYGNTTFADYILPKYLGGRNSGTDNFTFYGKDQGFPLGVPYSLERYKSKASTMRWYDSAVSDGNDFQKYLNKISNLIDTTRGNGGWINNFTHWHNYVTDGNQRWAEAYLSLLKEKNSAKEIHFCGYGEALAYMVYRQLIHKAVMFSPQSNSDVLKIQIETRNDMQVDEDLLQVPISIKFSTIGTSLQGKSIKSNCNLIAFGGDDYIVEIPYCRFPSAKIEIL